MLVTNSQWNRNVCFLLSSDEPISNSLWDKGCSVVFSDLQLYRDRTRFKLLWDNQSQDK